ncbi:mannose-specific lectin 3-like [Elaeis guineensis]|uniref:Mannose-specific lectin 3-like isoform X1 n=1 Tax=Elaeis guineensis var. tenera TaxID=51953 RepID=A0A6I9RS10_ELAGV|nr:mannose-specific lectin 3-like isoform X1 [Elaeis guineensis]
MAILPSIPTVSLLVILSSILILLTSPSTANEGNVLGTGDVLTTDSQLSYLDNSFVMQGDCNLVLYNYKGNGFQSNTHGEGVNCTLTLNDHGQFIIKSADGSTVWTTPPGPKKGNYSAVLRPDGEVVIYGPTVWSTPNFAFTTTGAFSSEMMNIPMVNNVLFSSQILYDNSKLATRDYTFIMKDDCNLALIKAAQGVIWETGTKGKGRHCFLRLDHRGQLGVEDDHYQTVWASKPISRDGDYVLILQINGQAVVYGPAVWSTSSG